MLLLLAILFILFEAVSEGLLKRFSLADFLFDLWIQWVIAIALFGIFFVLAYNFHGYYIPTWKIITGYIFVRFLVFDIAYNLSNGQKWNYYGDTKLYDRIMERTGSWGWFAKMVLGTVGVCFLMGWE